MVLQRDQPVPIWGWSAAGDEITVEFAGQRKTAVADDNGSWMIKLDPLTASSEPAEMVISGGTPITIKDVLVGEVWLAAGQSNMEWSVKQSAKEDQEFLSSVPDLSQVRAFHSPHVTAGIPLADGAGRWLPGASIQEQKSNSAVATFFAYKLHQELGVPVAFLDLNWGGRKIEKFIPDEGYLAAGLEHQPAGQEKIVQYIIKLENYSNYIDQLITQSRQGYLVLPESPPDTGNALNDIYNAMIAPVVPFAIRGAIWYQGESNRGDLDYFEKIKALSAGWSAVFENNNIPLLMVKIAPFDYKGDERNLLCDNIWAAQFRAEKEIPGVGVVPIHDTDITLKDIHPPHKRPVGERLAEMALARTYGIDGRRSHVAKVKEARFNNNQIIVTFEHADDGLATTDGENPTYFELSEDSTTFVPATASIVGNQVAVEIPADSDPKYVRMGWYEDVLPNLTAKDSWPVLPFAALEIK